MKKQIQTIILILLVLFPSKLCAEEKIKIGLLIPLSGSNGDIGKSILRSIILAVDKIDDKNIIIYPRNNFDNPKRTYDEAKDLYDNGVRIFIGPVFQKNTNNLNGLDDAVFLSFTNRIINKKNNIISAGVNANSQLNAINKFIELQGLKKTICLIPKDGHRKEIESAIKDSKIKFKKTFYYDTEPTKLTKRIEKITNYSLRKQNLADEIKRVENSDDPNKDKKIEALMKKDTIGKVNFDSIVISDFDETLKSITTSLIYTDVTPKKIYFITLNQWFDDSLLNEASSQNLYFPSVNKNNYDEFKNLYYKNYDSYPNQVSFLSYDLIGLIYFLTNKNETKKNLKIFEKKNIFKGKTGIFEIENKTIKHVLNFYKIENNKFKKIF